MERSPSIATARAASQKACDACRRRKLKCARPKLSSFEASLDIRCLCCQRSNILCTYNDQRRQKGPKTGRRLEAIRASQASIPDNKPREVIPMNLCTPPCIPSRNLSIPQPSSPQFDMPLFDESMPSVDDVFGSVEPVTAGVTTAISPPWSPVLRALPRHVSHQMSENQYANEIDSDHLSVGIILEQGAFSCQHIMTEVKLFFAKYYQRYPIINLSTLMDRIALQAYLSDTSFRTLLLSIFMINEASQFRHSPQRGTTDLDFWSEATEQSRRTSKDYHFADLPSLDDVIVSIFLFISYSVRDRHNRAFMYLTEAIGLMELVELPKDHVEQSRHCRVECLLYITEAASKSVYGRGSGRSIARKPPSLATVGVLGEWYMPKNAVDPSSSPLSTLNYSKLDKQASCLLYAMTLLYCALDTADVTSVVFRDDIMAGLIEDYDEDCSCSVQTADVAITKQWQLAVHWWHAISNAGFPSRAKNSIRHHLQIIGMTVVERTASLRPGLCRIVGHGKLAALIHTLFQISSAADVLPSCSSFIHDMIHTVSGADYEKFFAPELSTVQICIGEVPRSITSTEEIESARYGEDTVAEFPHTTLQDI